MGKKSRKKESRMTGGSVSTTSNGTSYYSDHPPELKSAIDAVARVLKLSEKQKLPIESYFSTHIHNVGSCDGEGCYNIISLFIINSVMIPLSMTEMSVITIACIRCHDNIRNTVIIPTDVFTDESTRKLSFGKDVGAGKTSVEYYNAFVEHQQNTLSMGFRKASYQHCSKLISDCLLRMKRDKKLLDDKEARTAVRIFGQKESLDPLYQNEKILPGPAPAPDVNTLWLVLNRPEYYCFHFSEDLHSFFHCEPGDIVINDHYLETSLTFFLNEKYNRERLLAMLDHMARWHMFGNEEEVASWLLWERKSMMDNAVDNPATIETMKNNIIMQLMVNKFFDKKVGELLLLVPNFTDLELYGKGLSNYLFYSQHMAMTGKLPPAFLLTATVAKDVGSTDSAHAEDELDSETTQHTICTTMKSLKTKRSSCVVCGATRSANGRRLSQCSKCDSVSYCCREHQIFHWKKGGHKQQCSK